MKRLSGHLTEVRKGLAVKKGVLLLVDFDGTLSPIVPDPKDAVLPVRAKSVLKRLARDKRYTVGIVTGRGLKDILKKVSLKGIIYAANHGFEIHRNGRFLLRLGEKFRKPLEKIADVVSEVENIPGAIIERKGLSVAIHYRRVPAGLRRKVKALVKRACRGNLRSNGLKMLNGKMMLEVRPADFWNKGKAVLWIWKKLAPHFLPVYIGDDTTDEDAFRALKGKGLTIRIGKRATSRAEYYVRDIREVLSNL